MRLLSVITYFTAVATLGGCGGGSSGGSSDPDKTPSPEQEPPASAFAVADQIVA